MSIAIISDVHIKFPGDEREEMFLSFLNHSELEDIKEIYLLGDIFDLMIGNHIEYFTLYNKVFEKIKQLIISGVKFHYFEGNHDFHLEDLVKKFLKLNDLNENSFRNYKKELFVSIGDKKCRFSHGDDIEIGNLSYKVYKSFITCPPLNFVANYIMPFSLLNAIGERASKASRKRNIARYTDNESNSRVQNLFREAAKRAFEKESFDFIFCGHSHVQEMYESSLGFKYFNIGYFPVTRSFFVLKNDEVSLFSV